MNLCWRRWLAIFGKTGFKTLSGRGLYEKIKKYTLHGVNNIKEFANFFVS